MCIFVRDLALGSHETVLYLIFIFNLFGRLCLLWGLAANRSQASTALYALAASVLVEQGG